MDTGGASRGSLRESEYAARKNASASEAVTLIGSGLTECALSKVAFANFAGFAR